MCGSGPTLAGAEHALCAGSVRKVHGLRIVSTQLLRVFPFHRSAIYLPVSRFDKRASVPLVAAHGGTVA
jgi:hypothetical protein